MKFRTLAESFQKIEDTPKRLEMTGLVLDLLKETPKSLVDKVTYLLQGRLYADFVGIELGVAEKLTIKALAKTLGVEAEDVDALRKKEGDIGLAAERVAAGKRQRALYGEPLTVQHVYAVFEKIAASTGAGSQELKLRLLGELFSSASPLETRYLVRLVTGKIRLGVAEQTIVDALALWATKSEATSIADLDDDQRKLREEAKAAVEYALNVTSDLALVAKTLLEDGLPAVKRLKIRLGVPLRPMLSERTESLEEALEKMEGPAQVEYKYDGIRVQAHLGKTIQLFSRRLENVTGQFPDLVEGLKGAKKPHESIVEGEVVAVDPKTGRIRGFQDVAQRRGRKYGLDGGATTLEGKTTSIDFTKEVPVRYFLFDTLYQDGEDLTDRPLEERRRILTTLFKENEMVVLAEAQILDAPKALEDYFDKVTAMGAEGIMIKNPRSPYKAGSRGWSWIKFKADYRADLADSFDLVVIGAYWGQGRRGGWYGGLLLASVNEETGRYESVTRLATGFDDVTLASLEKRFAPLVSKSKPKTVDSEEEPDVWIEPRVVVEVVGADITVSPRHRCAWGRVKEDAGLSIRFPRFTGRWREDKKPAQATTAKEILGAYHRRQKALARSTT